MKTKVYKTIDRASARWPNGPWDDEPDKIQWQDVETGLPCLAVRHHIYGNWCGYVGVQPEHPFFGLYYDDVNLDVHGGLTYSGDCDSDGDESKSICHIPDDGESDHVWWFGFDCNHANDISPYDIMRGYAYKIDGQYRDLEYVQQQCKKLAAQLDEKID